MSIPTPFNPMGTLGGMLPYVTPVMVSNNDWANKTGPGAASFGMELSYRTTRSDDIPTWKESIYKAYGGSEIGGSTGGSAPGSYSLDIIMTFERPLLVRSLNFEIKFSHSSDGYRAKSASLTDANGNVLSNTVSLKTPGSNTWYSVKLVTVGAEFANVYILHIEEVGIWRNMYFRGMDLTNSFYKK